MEFLFGGILLLLVATALWPGETAHIEDEEEEWFREVFAGRCPECLGRGAVPPGFPLTDCPECGGSGKYQDKEVSR